MMESDVAAPAPAVVMIGCGAIAESFHLPALTSVPGVRERLVLADPDAERARALADRFGVDRVVSDFRSTLEEVDAAVIAAPHRFHHPIGMQCLESGVHVLSEKPLAEDPSQAEELVSAAAAGGLCLAVNNTRRLIPACGRIQELIREDAIGPLEHIDFAEGDRFDWPSATGAMFGPAAGGRGVFLDVGAHVVDLVCWWLGAKPEVLSFRDDSWGGTEAVAHGSLSSGSCQVDIRLSWIAKQRNSVRIRGQRGRIDWGIYDWRTLSVTSSAGRSKTLKVDSQVRVYEDLSRLLVRDFLEVVSRGGDPLVPGREALPSIEVIDECYRKRRRFEMPWFDTSEALLS